MQDTEWVNAHLTELLATGQEPLMKFEIEVGEDNWIELNALDGKNYVEGISISLGGASMTPNPIGGTVKAALSNEDGIFHPEHPSSGYEDYLKTGRKVRASIGAKYGDTDYYWQRVIGFIDEPRFEALNQKVSISGRDYMKLLEDTELRSPDNYWGTYATFSSLPSDGILGSELYAEVDAMDINNEDPNVDDWPVTGACTFESQADEGGGSEHVGKLISTDSDAYTKNSDVGTAEAGKEYKVTFKYKRVTGAAKLRVSIWQDDGSEKQLAFISGLDSLDYETATIYFTAIVGGPIIMKVAIWEITAGTHQFRIDQISIWEFIPYEEISYQLEEASKGPYRVLLKQNGTWDDVWQGEEDEGWGYEESTRRVFFDHNKTIVAGTDNLKIYYYTTQALENIVADLLVIAGLYDDRAAALEGMDDTDPEVDIYRVRFKAGTTVLDAIKKICERCDYRFYFKHDGTPVFKAKPSYSDALTDGGLNLWDDADNLTNWDKSEAGTSTVNRESGEANKVEGAFSCRLDVDEGNSDVYISQTNRPLTPLKRHKLVIWYKMSVEGKTAKFTLRNTGSNVYLQDDGTWGASHEITLVNSTIWKKYEIYFYAHADYSSYYINLRRNDAASSLIYFDDVSIWREEFTFTDQKHIASFSNYQDKGEIKNRIVIEGEKQAEPVSKEETIPSELKGEVHDDTSIDEYGERTLTIKNHLFQDQDSITHAETGMCAILLAEYKDPKWYTDLEIPFNPVPLEMGDVIGWKERLSPTLEITRRGLIRDIKINKFTTTYKCENLT